MTVKKLPKAIIIESVHDANENTLIPYVLRLPIAEFDDPPEHTDIETFAALHHALRVVPCGAVLPTAVLYGLYDNGMLLTCDDVKQVIK